MSVNFGGGFDKAKIAKDWNALTDAQKDSIRKQSAKTLSIFENNQNSEGVKSKEFDAGKKDNKVHQKEVELPDGGKLVTSTKGGKDIQKTYYDVLGNITSSEQYEYDKSGNLKKEVFYNENGKVSQLNEYKDGNLVKSEEYDSDGNLQRRMEYKDGGLFSKPKLIMYRGDGTKETEIIGEGENQTEINYAEDGKTVISEE